MLDGQRNGVAGLEKFRKEALRDCVIGTVGIVVELGRDYD